MQFIRQELECGIGAESDGQVACVGFLLRLRMNPKKNFPKLTEALCSRIAIYLQSSFSWIWHEFRGGQFAKGCKREIASLFLETGS